MPEANKALVRRFYDAANRGALNDFDDFMAPDFIDHNALPGQSPGVQGLKEGIGAFRAVLQVMMQLGVVPPPSA